MQTISQSLVRPPPSASIPLLKMLFSRFHFQRMQEEYPLARGNISFSTAPSQFSRKRFSPGQRLSSVHQLLKYVHRTCTSHQHCSCAYIQLDRTMQGILCSKLQVTITLMFWWQNIGLLLLLCRTPRTKLLLKSVVHISSSSSSSTRGRRKGQRQDSWVT